MEHINWWQRRDRAPIVLIGLLLLGMALSFWAGCSGGLARERSRQLDQLRERVRADFAVMDQSLRGLLLDSRLRSELDAHGRAAEDLDRALEELENLSAGLPELLRVARGLRDFARNEHGRLHTQALERGESDRAKALELYLQTAAAVGTTRDRHLQALERQIQTAQFALGRQADRAWALGGAAALLTAAAAGMVLRRQAAAVKRAAAALVAALGRLRAGDFGARSEAGLDGDFAVVAAALDRLADEWDGLLREVRQAGATVQTAAGEAVTAARQQEGLAAEASRAATEIGSACGELAGKLTGCAAALGDVGALAGGAARRAAERQTELGQLETTLGTLHETAGRTGARLAALNEHLAGINSVIATVTKVADQTNLLSLNAAIEAEKAGEYGLGFAVVAMEMRRLADQTAVAAGELEKMLKELQAAVSTAVLSVEKLTEELRHGGEAVRHTGGQWSGLVQQVEEVPRRCQAVAEDAQAQTAAARRLGDQSAQLGRTADRVMELLRQSQAALGRLSEGVQQLQDRLARKSSSPQ